MLPILYYRALEEPVLWHHQSAHEETVMGCLFGFDVSIQHTGGYLNAFATHTVRPTSSPNAIDADTQLIIGFVVHKRSSCT